MRYFVLFLLALSVVVIFDGIHGCDLIVHLKSKTDKVFSGQIVAPNGQKSDKWKFTKNRQRETFHQKASECGLKDWQILIFDGNSSTPISSQNVSLNGIGRVLYEVKDDLKPLQTERQGAICNGQCATLST